MHNKCLKFLVQKVDMNYVRRESRIEETRTNLRPLESRDALNPARNLSHFEIKDWKEDLAIRKETRESKLGKYGKRMDRRFTWTYRNW